MIPFRPAPPAEATDAPGPMIEAVGVCKQYRQVRAVDDVSLAIRRGSCFGLLGPNGAGKTTLVEIMEDIIRPTVGTVRYKGRPRTARFRQEVGIMFQQTALLSFLTVGETLATFRRLYDQAEPIGDLIRLCRLDEVVRRHNGRGRHAVRRYRHHGSRPHHCPRCPRRTHPDPLPRGDPGDAR